MSQNGKTALDDSVKRLSIEQMPINKSSLASNNGINNPSKRTLRSSISAQSFKTAFRIGLRQNENNQTDDQPPVPDISTFHYRQQLPQQQPQQQPQQEVHDNSIGNYNRQFTFLETSDDSSIHSSRSKMNFQQDSNNPHIITATISPASPTISPASPTTTAMPVKSSSSKSNSSNSRKQQIPSPELRKSSKESLASDRNHQVSSSTNNSSLSSPSAGRSPALEQSTAFTDVPWNTLKARILNSMREYPLLQEGCPVQWISSLNFTWTSGIGAVNNDGMLILKGDESLVLPDLRSVKVISNLGKKYIEMIISPAQNALTRLIIAPTTDSEFYRWTGVLLLWSNLKVEGLESKISIPQHVELQRRRQKRRKSSSDSFTSCDEENGSVDDVDDDDENLLVGHFRLCIPYLKQKQRRISSASTTKHNVNNGHTISSSASISQLSEFSTPTINARGSSLSNNVSKPEIVSPFNMYITWQPVMGVLKHAGVFELLNESDGSLIQRINMQDILSSRVRQISESLFDCPRVIYMQPHGGILKSTLPSPTNSNNLTGQPYFYLRFENDSDYQDWFVHLRRFTKRRIFSLTSGNLFKAMRVSRIINLRILECKSNEKSIGDELPDFLTSPFHDTYVEVEFEKLIWGRTFVSYGEKRPFWREDLTFQDFPVRAPKLRLLIKKRLGAKTNPRNDPIMGVVDLSAEEIRQSKDIEKWYIIDTSTAFKEYKTNTSDLAENCSICVRIDYEEIDILSSDHYEKLHQLITANFTNNLTIQLAEHFNDLNKLSDILLKIFQAENSSEDWLTSLINFELSRIKDSLPLPSANNSTVNAAATGSGNGSGNGNGTGTISQQPDFKFNIDNTLFRGNTLVSKALERHMKLVGSEYLNKVIGTFVRKVVELNVILELDPSKLSYSTEGGTIVEQMAESNQIKLTKFVSFLWSSIRDSTELMPASFKLIFKRLRLDLSLRLQQDENVVFNAVSGFLFLRFFCPALLNPRLAGLVRGHPSAKVQRSLTLMAKMLQGFANRIRFGVKEPWMIPMNSFIDAHEQEMLEFYREITLSNQQQQQANEFNFSQANYYYNHSSMWLAMGDDLSNPYLIDRYENYAKLVELWSSRPEIKNNNNIRSNNTIANAASTVAITTSQQVNLSPKVTSSPSVSSVATSGEEAVVDTVSRTSSPVLRGRPNSAISSKFEDVIMDVLGETQQSTEKKSYHQHQQSYNSSSGRRGSSSQIGYSRRHLPTDLGKGSTSSSLLQPEDYLKLFEAEAYALTHELNSIKRNLTEAEIVDVDDFDDLISNTVIAFNVETGLITLQKYYKSVAKAAATAQAKTRAKFITTNTPMSPVPPSPVLLGGFQQQPQVQSPQQQQPQSPSLGTHNNNSSLNVSSPQYLGGTINVLDQPPSGFVDYDDSSEIQTFDSSTTTTNLGNGRKLPRWMKLGRRKEK